MITFIVVVAVFAMLVCSAVLLSALVLAGRNSTVIQEKPIVKEQPDKETSLAPMHPVH